MPHPLPNFLIAGAPKSGTTALANTLERHPDIYLPPLKEPKFLTAQVIPGNLQGPGDRLVESLWVRDERAYRRLFLDADGARAIGEGSVDLLYFADAVIPVIRRLLGRPRIIIVLRNPVDRSFSAYKQLLRDGRETLTFEEALDREDERRAANWEYMWAYSSVGMYARQVAAYLEHFDRVRIWLYDDLVRDPGRFLRQVVGFLGVDESVPLAFAMRHNPSSVPRNPVLRRLFRVGPVKLWLYRRLLAAGVSESAVLAVVDRLRPRRELELRMRPETRARLCDLFRRDVRELERLIDRDLSAWLS